jgi:flagellar biosynthesis GTPase FlhF
VALLFLRICFSEPAFEIVDKSKGDVLNQVEEFISRKARSVAPITPRVILLGPVGAGKKTQAQKVAKKYNIVNGKLLSYSLKIRLVLNYLS